MNNNRDSKASKKNIIIIAAVAAVVIIGAAVGIAVAFNNSNGGGNLSQSEIATEITTDENGKTVVIQKNKGNSSDNSSGLGSLYDNVGGSSSTSNGDNFSNSWTGSSGGSASSSDGSSNTGGSASDQNSNENKNSSSSSESKSDSSSSSSESKSDSSSSSSEPKSDNSSPSSKPKSDNSSSSSKPKSDNSSGSGSNGTGKDSGGTVVINKDKFKAGETVTVSYYLTCPTKFTAIDAYITYDSSVMTPVKDSISMPNIQGSMYNADTKGKILFLSASAAAVNDFSREKLLISCKFKINKSTSKSKINLNISEILDNDVLNIPDSTYTVTAKIKKV